MSARGIVLTTLAAWYLALLAGLACNLGDEVTAPCLHDDSCASGACHWGICVTGTCSGNTGCKAGWTCVDPPPSNDLLDLLTGNRDPIGYCALDCDGCPDEPRYSCESVCTFDHLPHLEIVAPMQTQVGRSTELRGVADLVAGRDVADAVWTLTNFSRGGALDLDGLVIEHTFDQSGDYELRLTVTDSAQVAATVSTHITVCQIDGGACETDDECCGEGYCEAGACHPAAVCGNGVLERGELCEGEVTDGTTCSDFEGHEGGPLLCRSDCLDYDPDSCDACGAVFANCSSDADCCAGLTCSAGVDFCS